MSHVPTALVFALLCVAPAGCGGDGTAGGEGARVGEPADSGPGGAAPDEAQDPEDAPSGPHPDSAAGPPPATGPGAALPGLTLPVILDRVHERTEAGRLRVLDDMIPPLETSVETVQNRHDPAATDTVRTLHYGGLDLEIYEVTSTGKEIVRSITVTDDTYDTGLGFEVGATRQELVQAMGRPARTEGSALFWRLSEGERDPTPTELAVELGPEDRVRSVTWSYYVD